MNQQNMNLVQSVTKIAQNKWGRFVLVRNMIVGWITHSLQSRDKTEILFHFVLEGIVFVMSLALIVCVFYDYQITLWGIFISFLVAHTIMFIVDGFLHTYLHDSLGFMKNAGVEKTVEYLKIVRDAYLASNATDCVLIYGSFCRRMFRLRSDIDIRVIRRKGFWPALSALCISMRLKWLSVFMNLPTDLLVVDSMEFIRRQMREDEKPVVIFMRGDVTVPEAGMSLDEVIADPTIVLKSRTEQEAQSRAAKDGDRK
ncbi:MAG: hypothetical protein JXM70_19290 [Pirellulales bacterium]|nr:hypothetical protein [Pirellulales bacterium]